MLIELKNRPECLERLLAEIDSSDTEDFKVVNSKMPYLDAVVTEINRLHSPVASTFRTVNREISVVSQKAQYTLLPGMLVFFALRSANRSVKDWGPDAGRFMPERWLGREEGETPLLSFGFGPRSCVSGFECNPVDCSDALQVGYKTALFGTKMYLLALLQMYRVVLKDHDYKASPGDILGVEKPLVVELYRRG
jgi:hypothetical protein